MSCDVVGTDYFYLYQAHILQNNIQQTHQGSWIIGMDLSCMCTASEVDVGDLYSAIDIQPVNLTEGMQTIGVVEQVFPIHKHFKFFSPTANWHLANRVRRIKAQNEVEYSRIISY